MYECISPCSISHTLVLCPTPLPCQVLHKVGEKHSVDASAVAIRWVLDQPHVASAVVGARNARHVRSLQSVFSFAFDEDDMLDIDAVYEGAANQPQHDVFVWERGGPW